MAKKNAPEVEVWQAIFNIGNNMRRILVKKRPELAPNKSTTLSQLKVMHYIMSAPNDRIKVKDLASVLDITSGGVSQIVNNLVRDGLVERQVCQEDRRASWVVLSEKGVAYRKQAQDVFDELTQHILADIEPEKRQLFIDILCDINRRFAEL